MSTQLTTRAALTTTDATEFSASSMKEAIEKMERYRLKPSETIRRVVLAPDLAEALSAGSAQCEGLPVQACDWMPPGSWASYFGDGTVQVNLANGSALRISQPDFDWPLPFLRGADQ